jgi:hypothetical protein
VLAIVERIAIVLAIPVRRSTARSAVHAHPCNKIKMTSAPVVITQPEFNLLAHAWCNAGSGDITTVTPTAGDDPSHATDLVRAIEFFSSWSVEPIPSANTSAVALTATLVADLAHEVSLLIHLHPIYQVPVLLFGLRLLDGTPLSFTQVLEWLPLDIRREHDRLAEHAGPAHALLSQAVSVL